MRATEFIVERKGGKIPKRQQNPTRGLDKVADGDRWNSDYKMYRLGLHLAVCDGVNKPDTPEESWVGRWKTLHPYSKEEQEMIKLAAKSADLDFVDVNKGDMRSMETDDVYTQSPVSNWMKK